METITALSDKDLAKACAIFDIPELEMRKLNEYGLLNSQYIKGYIIKQDYRNIKLAIKDKPEFSEDSILFALKREHHIKTIKQVRDILNGINQKPFFCHKCGKKISKDTSKQTGGLCHECLSEKISI